MQHVIGKRSFPQVYEMKMAKKETLKDVGLGEIGIDEDEMVEETNELTRADIFSKCYTQDGNMSNPEVAAALGQMQQLQSQLAPGEQDKDPYDIFSQVLDNDKGGRFHMCGSGITTKRIYGGDSLGHDDIYNFTKTNERLQKELQNNNKIMERLLRNEKLRGHENIMNVSSMSTSNTQGLVRSAQPSSYVPSVEHEKSSARINSVQTFAHAKYAHTPAPDLSLEPEQLHVPIKPTRPFAPPNFTPSSEPISLGQIFVPTKSAHTPATDQLEHEKSSASNHPDLLHLQNLLHLLHLSNLKLDQNLLDLLHLSNMFELPRLSNLINHMYNLLTLVPILITCRLENKFF